MKYFLVLIIALVSMPSFAHEARTDHLYIPAGFDNNDKVEVIVSGSFPSTCYSGNKSEVIVSESNIEIKMISIKKPNTHCEMISIPFTEVVDLGNLQGGNYNVTVNKSGSYEVSEKLIVETSQSESVDDHIYAIVDYVELGFTGGITGDVMLVGKSPSSCLVLDRVEYRSNGKDTLSILPIMKKMPAPCVDELSYLEVPLHFEPSVFPSSQLLLYVRSINGKSVTSLVNKK